MGGNLLSVLVESVQCFILIINIRGIIIKPCKAPRLVVAGILVHQQAETFAIVNLLVIKTI